MDSMDRASKYFWLTLVRHGQTQANQLKITQGITNTKLSDLGIIQAIKLGQYFQKNNVTFDYIFSSDLSRALDTAKFICGDCKPIANKLLRGRSFGIFEGRSLTVYYNAIKESNLKDPQLFKPKGGESLEQVYERVKNFSNKLLNKIKSGDNVLVVTQGTVVREFLRYFYKELNCPISETEIIIPPNTAFGKFAIYYEQNQPLTVKCIKIHEVYHLNKEEVTSNNDQRISQKSNTLI